MSENPRDKPENEEPESLADPSSDEIVVEPPKQASVARSAGIVSIAVMFSRLLGLVRETIFAKYFGAGFLYDAFIVGFRIPNLLRDLFAQSPFYKARVNVRGVVRGNDKIDVLRHICLALNTGFENTIV